MRASVSRVSIRHPRGRPDPTRYFHRSPLNRVHLLHPSIFFSSSIDVDRSTARVGSGRCHAPSTRMDPATHHPSSSARSPPPLERTPTHRRDRDRTRAIMHTSRRARLYAHTRVDAHVITRTRSSHRLGRSSSSSNARVSHPRIIPPSIARRVASLDDTRDVDDKKKIHRRRRRHRAVVVASPSSRRIAPLVRRVVRAIEYAETPSEGTRDTTRYRRSPAESRGG